MSVRIVDTPLECGPLASAFLAGAAPADWYRPVPVGSAAWTSHCREVARPSGAWLAGVRPALGAGAALLDRVATGGGVVVTTGQQPGLFGGPWYTWLKALAALEFANRIERETGLPAAPVFWAATDDADFTEAATTVIASHDGPKRLSLTLRPADGVPMAAALLGDEISGLHAELRSSVGSLADSRAMRAAESFRAGDTIGGAYVAMLRSLLEPLGIAVLDAGHSAVGRAAQPHLANALDRSRAVHEALVARRDALRAAGFDVPVATERALSMVFAWDTGADGLPRKRRIAVGGPDAHAQDGLRLSPNVLLRPVVERLLMPTCAYLGGPGELAYFAQVSAVAQALDVPVPLALPRWSGMILPVEVEDVLARLRLRIDDLRDPHEAEGRLARATLPADVIAATADLREVIDRDVNRLRGSLSAAALAGASSQLARRVDRIERRLIAAAKQREQATLRTVAGMRALLYPFGKPQERALNAVPFLSKYGDELVGMLRAACAAHAGWLIGGAGTGA